MIDICDSVVNLIVFFIVVFFFFQAEDGIRDVAVTGVQTCALPISARKPLYQIFGGWFRKKSFHLGAIAFQQCTIWT